DHAAAPPSSVMKSRRLIGSLSPRSQPLTTRELRCASQQTWQLWVMCGPRRIGNAIVGAAEPPTELAVDILQHHRIRVDGDLVVRVEVSSSELVQHGWALRDDSG